MKVIKNGEPQNENRHRRDRINTGQNCSSGDTQPTGGSEDQTEYASSDQSCSNGDVCSLFVGVEKALLCVPGSVYARYCRWKKQQLKKAVTFQRVSARKNERLRDLNSDGDKTTQALATSASASTPALTSTIASVPRFDLALTGFLITSNAGSSAINKPISAMKPALSRNT